MFKRQGYRILVFLFLVLFILSGANIAEARVFLRGVDITGPTTLLVGESAEIDYTLEPADSIVTATRWTSSNPDVASVADGVVTALSPGDTVIKVEVRGLSFTVFSSEISLRVTESYSTVGIRDLHGEVWVYVHDERGYYLDRYSPEKGSTLNIGDVIVTGENSWVNLSFPSMKNLEIGSDSVIIIDEQSKAGSKFSMLYGHVLGNVDYRDEVTDITFNMSQGVASIKETIFVLSENGRKSVSKVLDGVMEFTTTRNNVSSIEAGEQLSVSPTSTREISQFSLEEELKRWSKATQSQVQADLRERDKEVGPDRWVIFRRGEQLGPYNWEQILRYAHKGEIFPREMLWNVQTGESIQANQFPELARIFSSVSELDELIAGFAESIERAIQGNAAHPSFIEDLQEYLEGFRRYRDDLLEQEESTSQWGDY